MEKLQIKELNGYKIIKYFFLLFRGDKNMNEKSKIIIMLNNEEKLEKMVTKFIDTLIINNKIIYDDLENKNKIIKNVSRAIRNECVVNDINVEKEYVEFLIDLAKRKIKNNEEYKEFVNFIIMRFPNELLGYETSYINDWINRFNNGIKYEAGDKKSVEILDSLKKPLIW